MEELKQEEKEKTIEEKKTDVLSIIMNGTMEEIAEMLQDPNKLEELRVLFDNIARAIQRKTGSVYKMQALSMPDEIDSIISNYDTYGFVPTADIVNLWTLYPPY